MSIAAHNHVVNLCDPQKRVGVGTRPASSVLEISYGQGRPRPYTPCCSILRAACCALERFGDSINHKCVGAIRWIALFAAFVTRQIINV